MFTFLHSGNDYRYYLLLTSCLMHFAHKEVNHRPTLLCAKDTDKGLHFVKEINAIIALSLLKRIKIGLWKVPGQNLMFALVPRWVPGRVPGCPGTVGTYTRRSNHFLFHCSKTIMDVALCVKRNIETCENHCTCLQSPSLTHNTEFCYRPAAHPACQPTVKAMKVCKPYLSSHVNITVMLPNILSGIHVQTNDVFFALTPNSVN